MPDSPYSQEQRQAMAELARQIDAALQQAHFRLTTGGEPTFVSARRPDLPEWNTEPLGADKLELGRKLLRALKSRLAADAFEFHGLGKQYPGEAIPRWALACLWRRDGHPVWPGATPPAPGSESDRPCDLGLARGFLDNLVRVLGVSPEGIHEARAVRDGPLAGLVLPLLRVAGDAGPVWTTCRWNFSAGELVASPGPEPLGLRLPLGQIEWSGAILAEHAPPIEAKAPWPARFCAPAGARRLAAPDSVQIALCIEVRDGALRAFLPPVAVAENWLALVAALAEACGDDPLPLVLEGFPPPWDPRLDGFQVTPDPGVLEVNLQPAATWAEADRIFSILFEEAHKLGLRAWKFFPDGRRVGSGGGCHLTLGGFSLAESPLVQRPDLLRSLIGYWQNHPGLSYAFAGLFVGPTSQAPRIDEARQDVLYELEIALAPLGGEASPDPERIHGLLRHLLVDVTGNAHRAEFCIDKFFSSDNPCARRGLLELRALQMPPHPHMAALLNLLVRALVLHFFRRPWQGELIRWRSALHDRFALPYFLLHDLRQVCADLHDSGLSFPCEWLAPFLDFRFPVFGEIGGEGWRLELRPALEAWPVLGHADTAAGAASRPVDASSQRLQVLLRGPAAADLVVVCCGREVPLAAGKAAGERVAGVRAKTREMAGSLHPHAPVYPWLELLVVQRETRRWLGGCRCRLDLPWGKAPRSLAAARALRRARFERVTSAPRAVSIAAASVHPESPLTLDLRRPENS